MGIILEEPFWLAVLTAPTLFILWGVWNRARTRRAGRALVIGLAASAFLFVLQAAVETDREKLEATTQRLSEAVQRGDIAGIVALVDPAASISGLGDRGAFQRKVTSLLEKYTVLDNSIFGHEIKMKRDGATLTCRASCLIKSVHFTQTVRSRWSMEFVFKDGHWLISDVVPLDIDGMDFSSIGEIP